MIKEKRFMTSRFFIAFILTTLIFVAGLSVGYILSQQKLNHISQLEQDLLTETNAVELQFLILTENPCVAINSTPLTDELYSISTKLSYMENQLGEDDNDVRNLKNYYSTLQIRHYLLINRMREQCNHNLNTVLYFYNTKKKCPRCEEQGFILTYIRKKFGNVYVYAFDINLENPALRTLKSLYNIQDAPSIVVDGKPYAGFQTKSKVLDGLNITDNSD